MVKFITDGIATSKDIFNIVLLYLRAEQEKKKSDDGKVPNPFYLLYCFARFECEDNPQKISGLLSNEEKIDQIIKKYTLVYKMYSKKWIKNNSGKEYNDMIKAKIDTELLDECESDAADFMSIQN